MPRVKLTSDELEKYTRAFAALAELADTVDAHLPRLFVLMERHLLDELVTIVCRTCYEPVPRLIFVV